MKTIEIVTRTMDGKGNAKRELTCPMKLPETIEEAVKMFGAETVLSHFEDNIIIGFQANVRGKLAKDGDDRMSDKAIVESMATWKPGQRKLADPKKKAESIKAVFAKLDPATRKALLADLRQTGS